MRFTKKTAWGIGLVIAAAALFFIRSIARKEPEFQVSTNLLNDSVNLYTQCFAEVPGGQLFDQQWSLAEQGDSDAQYKVGVMLDEGLVVPQNRTAALEHFELAAANGNGAGHYNIALGYEDLVSRGVPSKLYDEYRGIIKERFELAAASGFDMAHYNLGLIFEKGLGLSSPDYAKAREHYRIVSESHGHIDAQYRLGRLLAIEQKYYDPKDININIYKTEEALGKLAQWYNYFGDKVAESAIYRFSTTLTKNPASFNNLGLMLLRGEGAPKNETAAFELFQRAIQGGNADAYYNLGEMYEKGLGVPQDLKAADEQYRLYFAKAIQPSLYEKYPKLTMLTAIVFGKITTMIARLYNSLKGKVDKKDDNQLGTISEDPVMIENPSIIDTTNQATELPLSGVGQQPAEQPKPNDLGKPEEIIPTVPLEENTPISAAISHYKEQIQQYLTAFNPATNPLNDNLVFQQQLNKHYVICKTLIEKFLEQEVTSKSLLAFEKDFINILHTALTDLNAEDLSPKEQKKYNVFIQGIIDIYTWIKSFVSKLWVKLFVKENQLNTNPTLFNKKQAQELIYNKISSINKERKLMYEELSELFKRDDEHKFTI